MGFYQISEWSTYCLMSMSGSILEMQYIRQIFIHKLHFDIEDLRTELRLQCRLVMLRVCSCACLPVCTSVADHCLTSASQSQWTKPLLMAAITLTISLIDSNSRLEPLSGNLYNTSSNVRVVKMGPVQFAVFMWRLPLICSQPSALRFEMYKFY